MEDDPSRKPTRLKKYDHIIRDREDYETRRKYIFENPIKRYYKERDPAE